jgi:hypothetical protein
MQGTNPAYSSSVRYREGRLHFDVDVSISGRVFMARCLATGLMTRPLRSLQIPLQPTPVGGFAGFTLR